MVSGILTAILIVAFCGICVWAWSDRRRDAFDAAARLALDEDKAVRPTHETLDEKRSQP
jgi:cytochrome c oxidase cbb3-type subunit 4